MSLPGSREAIDDEQADTRLFRSVILSSAGSVIGTSMHYAIPPSRRGMEKQEEPTHGCDLT
jgi:hypothetical protein